MGGEPRYASDYFDQLYSYAIELIKKGLAYVDELSPSKFVSIEEHLHQQVKTVLIVIAV